MRPWHFSLASTHRFPLFPEETRRLAAVRALARACRGRLCLFNLVDDHAHVIALSERERRADLARAIKLALAALAAAPTQPVWVGEVRDRAHLLTLRRYVLAQTDHHGLPVHAALWGGGCFADLVGARRIPGVELRLQEVLPRFRLADAFADVGLACAGIAPADDEAIRRAGARALAAASAAAHGVPGSLTGHAPGVVAARQAACTLAGTVGLPGPELAEVLRIDPRSARRLVRRGADPAALAAVRTRLALESLVAREAPPKPG